MYKDLAKFLGCNPSYISQLLSRPLPPNPLQTDIYAKLDKFFGSLPGTFESFAMLDLHGAQKIEQLAPFMFADRGHLAQVSKLSQRVPMLGFTEGTHPDLCTFDANNPPDVEEYVEAPPGGDGSQFYALRVKGSSMSPRYNEGDIVYLSPGSQVNSGEEAIVVLEDGQCMLKKVKVTDDSVILISIQGEPVVIPRSKVRCMHRLMWVKR